MLSCLNSQLGNPWAGWEMLLPVKGADEGGTASSQQIGGQDVEQ